MDEQTRINLLYLKDFIQAEATKYYFEPTWEGKITFRLLEAAEMLVLAAEGVQRDGAKGFDMYAAEKLGAAQTDIAIVIQYLGMVNNGISEEAV